MSLLMNTSICTSCVWQYLIAFVSLVYEASYNNSNSQVNCKFKTDVCGYLYLLDRIDLSLPYILKCTVYCLNKTEGVSFTFKLLSKKSRRVGKLYSYNVGYKRTF